MAIKHAILGLLQYKNMHGYKIKGHIEKNFGNMWSINYGQIYPNLKSLLGDGLIEIAEMDAASVKGPNRKLYSITGAGRKEFKEWLRNSPEGNMILRDPFLLRFIFFGFGERDRAVEMIDEQIRLYQRQLAARKKNSSRFTGKGACVRLVSELGLEFNEMVLKWLKRAREEMLHNFEDEADVIRKAL